MTNINSDKNLQKILSFITNFHIVPNTLNFIGLNSKTLQHDLKSRDRRRLAADCYECKTLKQLFKTKYRFSLTWKSFVKICFSPFANTSISATNSEQQSIESGCYFKEVIIFCN